MKNTGIIGTIKNIPGGVSRTFITKGPDNCVINLPAGIKINWHTWRKSGNISRTCQVCNKKQYDDFYHGGGWIDEL